MKNTFLVISWIIQCWIGALAQSPLRQESIVRVNAAGYMDSLAGWVTLFYGTLQEPYEFISANHPYFKDSRYAKGELSYGGAFYPNVLLRWDINRDELIAFTPDNYHVVLSPDKSEEVLLHGHHLIYLKKDSLINSPPPGYYILLYAGECTALAKPSAVLQKRSYQYRIENFYSITTKYYVIKEGTYFPVKNKNALLNTLGDYHRELNRLTRTNRLSFRRDPETMLVEVMKEYEKLKYLP